MRCFLLFVIALPLSGFAQFFDDFGDGNFTNNPTWNGDVAKFEIDGNFVLHLNAPAATDTAYLSTTSDTIDNTYWECYAEMAFNPSGANFAKVYVVSDQSDLNGPLNGYFVKLGSTTDEISLYRQDGFTETEIIDGLDGRVNMLTVTVRIRVTRDNLGNWQLMSDTTGGTNWFVEGSALDNTYATTNFFGVHCTYTSTRSDKFWFDDIFVSQMPTDTIAPSITGLQVISGTQLDVYFSEWVKLSTAEATGNYSADNGIGTPISASRDGTDSSLVHLAFGSSFPNGIWNLLTVSGVEDLSNNPMNTQADSFLYFTYQPTLVSDVIINEIMADKSPSVGLPEVEYLELYNRSNKVFDLYNWTISDGTTTGALPSYFLLPDSYVILCSQSDSVALAAYGTVLPPGSWPTLNDSGDSLMLKDSTDQTVNQVNYSNQWYRDDSKDDGGWSLELINPFDSCNGALNWIASTNPTGGSPGTQNSVYDPTPDTEGPLLLSVQLVSADTLLLTFNEPIDIGSFAIATYSFSPPLSVLSTVSAVADNHQLWMLFSSPADTGTEYSLILGSLTDCPGNLMLQGTETFMLPFSGRPGDIIINEVLFNPVINGADFVEVYNRSGKPVSLRNWKLANYDEDTISNFQNITSITLIIEGSEFLVLTKDSANIKKNYPLSQAGTFIQMGNLPTYRDDSSTVYLINDKELIVDKFSYTDSMHFSLLHDTEGKSLERLDADRPTNEVSNWHTAAESVGFATPGYENSQYNPSDQLADAVSINPEVFSPDNDGIDDVLNISYQFDQPGYVANIKIYDAKGRLIRLLIQNELLGIAGTISWDGTNDARERARVGIHIIYFEVFDLTGTVLKFKKTCVVAAKL